jgi:hypothetical protein
VCRGFGFQFAVTFADRFMDAGDILTIDTIQQVQQRAQPAVSLDQHTGLLPPQQLAAWALAIGRWLTTALPRAVGRRGNPGHAGKC